MTANFRHLISLKAIMTAFCRHLCVALQPQLTQHLGIPSSEMIIEPYTKIIKLQSADRFLLCSDGLSDMVPITKIQEIVSRPLSPIEVVQLLTKMAMQNGGRDNITIILCDISK